MKKQVKINKYPYLLWLHYRKDLEVDLENQIVKSDIAESKIKKVANWKIFLMKYLPFFLILIFGVYPQHLVELKVFAIALFVVAISSIILVKFLNHFKKYLILITSIGYYVIFTNSENIELIDLFSIYTAEIIIVIVLIRDIYLKKYTNYYSLIDIKKINKVTIAKKHERPLIPLWFGRKGLFKMKRGFNLGFDFSIGGYFMRIENEAK
ncbi:hypothetical protein [Malaciobacter mytili]|uniref:hypothetical protein n=1 Tax=Malaciobacter mytili TaxID=603050 RepID=UPI003A8B4800